MTLSEEFFSDLNEIDLEGDDPTSELARRYIDSSTGPKVLPWKSHQGTMRWYVLAPPNFFERVKEEILAHVGVSYTNYRGQVTSLDSDDAGDSQAKLVSGDDMCIRVDLITRSKQQSVSRAFGRWLTSWNVRPVQELQTLRTLGEVLHEYRMSIQALNQVRAEEAMEEARRLGFGAVNLQFMELELRHRFEGADSVLAHPSLAGILAMKRPAAVSDILAQAIDQKYLRPESGLTPVKIGENFNSLSGLIENSDLFKKVLTSIGQVRSPSGLLLLGLWRASQGDSLSELRSRLTDEEPYAEIYQIFENFGTPTESVDDETTDGIKAKLQELLLGGRYDEALTLAESVDPTYEAIHAGLTAAYHLDNFSAIERTRDLLGRATPEVQERLKKLQPLLLSVVMGFTKSEGPGYPLTDWNDCFAYFIGNPDWPSAIEAFDRGSKEWPVFPFINDRSQVEKLRSHILDDRLELERVVPYLLEWLSRVPDRDRSATLILEEALAQYLALSNRSDPGLEVLGQVAHRLVSFGLEPERFKDLLDHLKYRWEVSKSPLSVSWAMDLVEVLIDSPCPDSASVTVFYTDLFRSINEVFSRVSPELQRHIVSLAVEVGLDELLPELKAEEPQKYDDRRYKVGFYSLTEGALRRAKSMVNDAWPAIEVVTRSDLHATDELRNLSRTAHLMVVGIGSAQHAATGCIKDNRPTEKPTRQVNGKGSAAFVRELASWLDEVN